MHQYKKEMKGAVRELRKDNKYIAKERIDEQLHRDTDRWVAWFCYSNVLIFNFYSNSKVKSLYSTLSSQQADINAEKRAKKRKWGGWRGLQWTADRNW